MKLRLELAVFISCIVATLGNVAILSRKVIAGLLRQRLRNSGVVITDDLVMVAITNFVQEHHVAAADVLAVKVGNDRIMATDYQTEIPSIAQAVHEGQISVKQINASVLWILQLKRKLGLLDIATFVLKHSVLRQVTLTRIRPSGGGGSEGEARGNLIVAHG